MRYLFVALPQPGERRMVFRPARRVSWATRIFTVLVLIVAVGAVAGFLLVALPQRVAELGQNEARELAASRTGATSVGQSVGSLWTGIGAPSSLGLSTGAVTQDLVLSQSAEKSVADALTHVGAAKAFVLEADGIPLQLHSPAFVSTDQPVLQHLEASLQTAARLAHGATLQLTIAQHVISDAGTISGQLDASLQAHDWTGAARTAAQLQDDLKTEQQSILNPETLLDPLWAKWADAMNTYCYTAQQMALASADGQTRTANDLRRGLAAQQEAIATTRAAALANGSSWRQKTVQPLLDTVTKELTAAG